MHCESCRRTNDAYTQIHVTTKSANLLTLMSDKLIQKFSSSLDQVGSMREHEELKNRLKLFIWRIKSTDIIEFHMALWQKQIESQYWIDQFEQEYLVRDQHMILVDLLEKFMINASNRYHKFFSTFGRSKLELTIVIIINYYCLSKEKNVPLKKAYFICPETCWYFNDVI